MSQRAFPDDKTFGQIEKKIVAALSRALPEYAMLTSAAVRFLATAEMVAENKWAPPISEEDRDVVQRVFRRMLDACYEEIEREVLQQATRGKDS